MSHDFDKTYWEDRWRTGANGVPAAMAQTPPNPYLVRAVSGLAPGTALDAGCGAGAEAIWLATQGWRVTGADISSDALGQASRRAVDSGLAEGQVEWVEADLTSWTPATQYGLVVTNYAHPSIPQLDFYRRISAWVAPGGTLLIVGHLHSHGAGHGHHDDQPPAEASVMVADVSAVLDEASWQIVAAEEQFRTVTGPGGHTSDLHDVVVQATRLS
ncbi:class I SAM-dependent methyltransferase [Kribbella sp. NPDC056861]|uniref:class I SAM-dependent methyltransferase n=1 Tax=Kribbella sp. NPDC056861 TaxID=3154857 RepID=UPI00342FB265